MFWSLIFPTFYGLILSLWLLVSTKSLHKDITAKVLMKILSKHFLLSILVLIYWKFSSYFSVTIQIEHLSHKYLPINKWLIKIMLGTIPTIYIIPNYRNVLLSCVSGWFIRGVTITCIFFAAIKGNYLNFSATSCRYDINYIDSHYLS